MMMSNVSNPEIYRPEGDAMASGTYRAKVYSASTVSSKGTPALLLRTIFWDEKDYTYDDTILLRPRWENGSVFRRLLEFGGCLPEPNEPFTPQLLEGLRFLFTVEINTKGNRTYVNLVDVSVPDDEQ